MALVADETKIVTIDEKPRAVETLPEQARQLVRFYDDWKQRELEARSNLLMAQTAMRALANDIAAVVAKADAEAAEAAAPTEAQPEVAPVDLQPSVEAEAPAESEDA